MTQWEVVFFPYPSPEQSHPCVVISSARELRDTRIPTVNALLGKTKRGDKKLLEFEVLLDSADGMDHETVVACNIIFSLKKTDAGKRVGVVSHERRRRICRSIISSFELRSS